jgi:hypothetical protein
VLDCENEELRLGRVKGGVYLRRRPHDLGRSYIPLGLEVGIDIGGTDTVFFGLDSRRGICV